MVAIVSFPLYSVPFIRSTGDGEILWLATRSEADEPARAPYLEKITLMVSPATPKPGKASQAMVAMIANLILNIVELTGWLFREKND